MVDLINSLVALGLPMPVSAVIVAVPVSAIIISVFDLGFSIVRMIIKKFT